MASYSLRKASKSTLGEMLWPSLGRAASRFLFRGKRGLILMFHYIGQPVLAGAGEDLFLTRAEFARILDFVRAKLCPLDPQAFLAGMRSGTLPPGATMLTFDDCTERAVVEGLPELVSRDLKACYFANPGLIDAGRTVPALELMDLCRNARSGRYQLRLTDRPSNEITNIEISSEESRALAYRILWPKVLACPSRGHAGLLASIRETFGVRELSPDVRLASWSHLESLHSAGMLIGNHTMLHSTVQADGVDQFTADVAEAYRIFESRFGTSARVFCYPHGRAVDATSAATASLSALGTDYGFVSQGGIACAAKTGLLKLRREEAAYSVGAVKLAPLLAAVR
jgi:peptidoglycan/xylan/chitin deacetylase (PgdA/CDA1 family)